MLRSYLLPTLLLAMAPSAASLADTNPAQTAVNDAPTKAPLLSRNPINPRYFATPDGDAVFLTGAHTWNNLQDKGPGDPPQGFDWGFYLDFLEAHHHNFIRLWSWQTIHDSGGHISGATTHPWHRTGPGMAIDGEPRFDLTELNDAYFDRLRERVATAAERGIYVDIMLFEGWVATVGNPGKMQYHAFAEGNNINGINVLANPRDNVYAGWVSLDEPEVVRLQELYVKRVVETVNEFDNVIYEIANEPTGVSHEWQEHFVNYIGRLEAHMPKQHVIGTPGGMKTHNRKMFAGSADWVSPDIQAPDDPDREGYKLGTMTWGEPDYDQGNKVVILDTDHLWGLGGNVSWAWQSFCRGYNVLYMDPGTGWPGAFFKGTARWSRYPNHDLRREIGKLLLYSKRVDLNHTLPHNELSSTGYCLAQPGVAYICFQPESGNFTIEAEAGAYLVEWHFPETGETRTGGETTLKEGKSTFRPPLDMPTVLFLQTRQAANVSPPDGAAHANK